MLPHRAGTIINIGSIAGRTAYEGAAAYCAAKAGELPITRSLRLQLCGECLRVATIDPSWRRPSFAGAIQGRHQAGEEVYEGVQALRSEDVAKRWSGLRAAPHVCITR